MSEIFLYVSTGLILFAYVLYFLIILYGNTKKINGVSGFDVVKDIISEYNSINVIESKNYFSIYNMKRRVIKLSTSSYYGDNLSSISLSLIEAGISVVDKNKNKYIEILKKIFSNLKILYIFPIIAVLISNSSFNFNDAKIGVVVVFLFVFLAYIVLEIKFQCIEWISNNLMKITSINKDNCVKIIKFINNLLFFDKLIYFGELIIIVRFVLLMFGF